MIGETGRSLEWQGKLKMFLVKNLRKWFTAREVKELTNCPYGVRTVRRWLLSWEGQELAPGIILQVYRITGRNEIIELFGKQKAKSVQVVLKYLFRAVKEGDA